MTPKDQRWQVLGVEAGKVFTPRASIDERSLFAGRDEQVQLICDVINQKGAHAILFGERGVGKTSLVSVLPTYLNNPAKELIMPRVNCDTMDTFATVWRKAFAQVEMTREVQSPGYGNTTRVEVEDPTLLLGDTVSPDSVRLALTILAKDAIPIFIFDEFDRLSVGPRRAFADTVKGLSDQHTGATIIAVGVADSVDSLIQEHQSVERALVQIRMPRMSAAEISQIIQIGLERLEMKIENKALARIINLAQGLPHYAHLIGLHAARFALDNRSTDLTVETIERAIDRAINNAQQSIRSAYEFATRSPRKDNLFADVLLSCALAQTNDLGYFAAQDVRRPLREITGKAYEIPTFAQHLNEFSDEKRGNILQKTGVKRRFRYRFTNPLLQPFVIMRGMKDQRITGESLITFS
jgi:Cdc6-like AAA superfamily ATPase